MLAIKYMAVAAMYGLCGALSATFESQTGPAFYLLSVPFSLLSAVLFLRRWTALIAVPVMGGVWFVAFFAAEATWIAMSNSAITAGLGLASVTVVALMVGGATGGLGIMVAAGIVHFRVITRWRLLDAVIVGAVFAIALEPWTSSLGLQPGIQQPRRLQYGLAVWQAAMGTYLFAVSRRAA